MNGRLRNTPLAIAVADADGYIPSFYNEIYNIMRGLGDSQTPIRESVILMEKILKQQLQGILYEAAENAQRRFKNGNTITVQARDILFLMRHNRIKAMRLVKFFRDYNDRKEIERTTSVNSLPVEAEPPKQDRLPPHFLDDMKHYFKTWKKNIRDEEKIRRAERADYISSQLDGQQYLDYAKSRAVSFCAKNAIDLRIKLRNWLIPGCEICINESAMLALGFLVHETIARIVDMSLLARMDATKKTGDTFDKLAGGRYCTLSAAKKPNSPDFLSEGAGVKALTSAEISEAIRRYNQPAAVPDPLRTKINGPRLIAIC